MSKDNNADKDPFSWISSARGKLSEKGLEIFETVRKKVETTGKDDIERSLNTMREKILEKSTEVFEQARKKVEEMNSEKDGKKSASWADIMYKKLNLLSSEAPPIAASEPAFVSNSSPSFGLFSSVNEQAAMLQKTWGAFYAGMCEIETDPDRKRQFKVLDQNFRTALEKLAQELASPELRIATTGTTSSGKSSVVNLLAGGFIMPVEEREMSAGVVAVRHSRDDSRRLKIHKTLGAKWECGEWRALGDADIKKRLTDTMHVYNESRGGPQTISPPEIELDYPLDCFKSGGLLSVAGLPENTRFMLIDLPGLRNVTDEVNRQIVARSKESLCLVTYNMAETDENKRQALVAEVLSQIKAMGGSPARMLFVLNRIDVFRKDGNWEKVEVEESERRKKEISQTLREHLPEHRHAIERLVFSRLSSAPAHYSRRMANPTYRIEAVDHLFDYYRFLIPKEIKNDVGYRPFDKWEDHDFKRVGEAVWNISYGAEFAKILRSHIEEHFQTLVLPPMVVRFEGAVNEAISQAVRTCNSVLNSSEERYTVAKKELDETDRALKEFLKDARNQLLEPLKKRLATISDNTDETLDLLECVVEDWMKEPMFELLDANALAALYTWKDEMLRNSIGVVEAAARSLILGNIDFSKTSAATMSAGLQDRLKKVIKKFQEDGYDSSCAKAETEEEKIHVAKSENEKQKIQKLREGAMIFSNRLEEIVEELVQEHLYVETARVQDTLQASLLHCYSNYVNTGLKQKSPDWSLNVPRVILNNLSPPDIQRPSFKRNLIDSRMEEERNPWRLWFTKRDIEIAVVPSGRDLATEWSLDIKQQINLLLKPFSDQLEQYLQELQEKVDKIQHDVFHDIGYKLNKEYGRHSQDYEFIKEQWEPLQRHTKALGGALHEMKKVVGMS